jgi:hypothetical protein
MPATRGCGLSPTSPDGRVELADVRRYGTIFNTLAAVYDVPGTVGAVAKTEGDAT